METTCTQTLQSGGGPTLETSLVEWKRDCPANLPTTDSPLGNFLSGMETGGRCADSLGTTRPWKLP